MRAIALISVPALIASSAALAQVTAEDVWQNMQAPVIAMGGQMEAELARKNNSLDVGETTITFPLPMGLGEVVVVTSGMSLAENGDGTVALLYPAELSGAFRVTGPEGLLAAASMTMSTSAYSATASGQPGDVSYVYSLDNGSFQLGDFEFPEAPEMSIDMTGLMTGMRGSYRIVEGDITRFEATGSNGDVSYEMSMLDDLGIATEARQATTGGTSTMSLAIPTGRTSLMNLSQALRDGLTMNLETSGSRIEVFSSSSIDGNPIAQQSYGYLLDTIVYSLDPTGVKASGANSDIWFEQSIDEFLPLPIKGTVTRTTGALDMPLNKTDGPTDATLSMSIEGLSVDEGLWGMVDPGGQLPRDPARLELDVTGKLVNLMDLLDITSLMAMGPDAGAPLELNEITLNRFALEMVGASMTGQGAFTLDNSDWETFDGIPAPDGGVDIEIIGANGLIDTLVGMGLLPEEQAMGARMMMGLFTVPGDGEDVLTSRIDVRPNGEVSANGQRLR